MIDNSRRNNPFKFLQGINKVHTKDSTNITWTGTGTSQDPLMVSVVGGGGGGSSTWGSITGTLSDQTDLNSTLNTLAPKSSPTFTNQIGIGTAAISGARIALPSGITAADGILFGDIDVFRESPTVLSIGTASLRASGLVQSASSDNATIAVEVTGALITRNIADNNHALSINLVNVGSTGRVLDLQFGGTSVASVNRFGGIVATNLGHATGAFGMITLNSTGVSITRNTADGNTALIIDQQHASSTGNIVEFLKAGTAKALIDVNGKLVLMDHTTNAGGIQFGNTSPFYLYRSSGGGLTVSTLTGTGTRMVVADASGVLSTQAIPGGGGAGDMTKAVYDSDDDGIIDANALPELVLSSTYFGGAGTTVSPIVPHISIQQIINSTPGNNNFLKYNTTGSTWEAVDTDATRSALGISSVDNMSFNDINNTTATIGGTKTFGSPGDIGKLKIAGNISGAITLLAPAVAGSSTVTFPATGTLATLDGTETFTNKTLTSPIFTGTLTGGDIVVGNLQTNSVSTFSNLAVWASTAVATSQSTLQFAGSTNITARIWERGVSSPSISAGNAYSSHIIGIQNVNVASSGTHPMFAQFVVKGMTVSPGAGAITNAATVYIDGVLSNQSPTGRNDALRVDGQTYINGKLNLGSVQEYTDNAAALTDGLITGDVYRTGDTLKIVHV